MRGPRLAIVVLALLGGVAASHARASDTVTISFLALNSEKVGYDVLVPNFERVYPNVEVNVTYASLSSIFQLELTELGAGSAPDVLTTFPGCGTPISVCTLAKAGALAPMVNKPWARRSLPLVTSLSKHDGALYAFESLVAPVGVFTNDTLFRKLGLTFPQTFSQFLALCRKAKAAGTVAFLDGGDLGGVDGWETLSLAAPVYAADPHFTAEQRAGKATFADSPGWHQALQELLDMNDAGCFEPGVTGTSTQAAGAEFVLGQGLMHPALSAAKGGIDATNPPFGYSFRPFPNGSGRAKPVTVLNLSPSLSVNAHSDAQHQAAAQAFVDFLARPEQNALYARIRGGLTQYEFLKGQIPSFMSAFATVFTQHQYLLNPSQSWWNAGVAAAFAPITLLTGQQTIDGLLNAMDDAWKQGPT